MSDTVLGVAVIEKNVAVCAALSPKVSFSRNVIERLGRYHIPWAK
jgi:hypothetical protein